MALVVVLVELTGLAALGGVAGAEERPPSLTVADGASCGQVGGEWLEPGYCEITGPLRVAPEEEVVLATGAFILGPVAVEGRLEVRGAASLVFTFGPVTVQGQVVVTEAAALYLSGPAVSAGSVELAAGGRMEILSDGGSLVSTGRIEVGVESRLDVYGSLDNQGRSTNMGAVAVWCGGSIFGLAPLPVAAQVQDCRPPQMRLVSRTPADTSGWNHGAVTVTWACVDDRSGVVADRVTAVLTGDGSGQTAFGVCTDLAGNTVSGTVTGINIVRPAPRTRRQPTAPVTVQIVPSPPAAGSSSTTVPSTAPASSITVAPDSGADVSTSVTVGPAADPTTSVTAADAGSSTATTTAMTTSSITTMVTTTAGTAATSIAAPTTATSAATATTTASTAPTTTSTAAAAPTSIPVAAPVPTTSTVPTLAPTGTTAPAADVPCKRLHRLGRPHHQWRTGGPVPSG